LAAVVEVDPAIAYLERQALPLAETALIAWCREWSVELPISDRLEREQAHRVWALRLRLSPTGQTTFDTLSITARLHLAEVYHEVLAPGVAAWDASRQPTSGTA
jgi:hypothetical protein